MKKINEINTDIKDTVLLVGRGSSVDSIDWKKLQEDNKYDIATLSYAINLVDKCKFGFGFHLSLKQYIKLTGRSEFFILPESLIKHYEERNRDNLEQRNLYCFNSITDFDLNKEYSNDELFNCYGTVVGAVQFLHRMGYKKIKYIGFDGGELYGELVSEYRKPKKKIGAIQSYVKSWEKVNEYVSHFNIEFEKLNEYKIRDTLLKEDIIKREKEKYNQIHEEVKYGGMTGRVKWFKRNTDDFHLKVKHRLKRMCNSMLDVGCGKVPFMRFFKAHYPHIKLTGIDIWDGVLQYKDEFDVHVMDVCNMDFPDNSFDIVCHFDGLEHIPPQLEDDVLNEEYRVTKKFIYHTIAVHYAKHHDIEYEEKGLGAIHINIKSADDWREKFEYFCMKNDMALIGFEDYGYAIHVLLEKL